MAAIFKLLLSEHKDIYIIIIYFIYTFDLNKYYIIAIIITSN